MLLRIGNLGKKTIECAGLRGLPNFQGDIPVTTSFRTAVSFRGQNILGSGLRDRYLLLHGTSC